MQRMEQMELDNRASEAKLGQRREKMQDKTRIVYADMGNQCETREPE